MEMEGGGLVRQEQLPDDEMKVVVLHELLLLLKELIPRRWVECCDCD